MPPLRSRCEPGATRTTASPLARMALPATHSTLPTNWVNATAPAAAPVGGYVVLANCFLKASRLGVDGGLGLWVPLSERVGLGEAADGRHRVR